MKGDFGSWWEFHLPHNHVDGKDHRSGCRLWVWCHVCQIEVGEIDSVWHDSSTEWLHQCWKPLKTEHEKLEPHVLARLAGNND